MRVPLITSFYRNFKRWRKSKKLSRFKRTPRVFVPTGSRWWIVIPYKPIGLGLIILLLLLSVYLLFRSDIFLVRDLEVVRIPLLVEDKTGINLVDEEEVRKVLSDYLASSIFFVDTQEIKKKLLQKFLAIKMIEIEKEMPDKIKVSLSEREPLAVLKMHKVEEISEGKRLEYDQFFLVDEEGVIFAKVVKKQELPEFVLTQEGLKSNMFGNQYKEGEIVGSKIEGEVVVSALKIVESFEVLDFVKPTSFLIDENGEIVVITDVGWQVLFAGKESSDFIDEQIASLQAITSKAKMEGRSIKKIDLRFKRPVVVY